MNGRLIGLLAFAAAIAALSHAQPSPVALTNAFTMDALRQQAAERGVTLEAYAALVGAPVEEALSDTNATAYLEEMRLAATEGSVAEPADVEPDVEPALFAVQTGTNALEYLAQRREEARLAGRQPDAQARAAVVAAEPRVNPLSSAILAMGARDMVEREVRPRLEPDGVVAFTDATTPVRFAPDLNQAVVVETTRRENRAPSRSAAAGLA